MLLRTPLVKLNNGIRLKPEHLQPFKSYKIRGVANAISVASKETLANGIVTASAGNMAQSVAYLARENNISCQVFAPLSAPKIKKDAIRSLGAELIELPFSEIWTMVRYGYETKSLFIHPVFTDGLLEGYSSIAREILEDEPTVDAIVIPFGVGGLTLAIAKLIKQHRPKIRIITAEPETAAPLAAAYKSGGPIAIIRRTSFIDAIGTPEVLPQVFSRVQSLIDGCSVVSIDEAEEAVRELFFECNYKVEGASAVAYAAAKNLRNEHSSVVAILSGGNIDDEVFSKIIKRYNKKG